MHIVEFSLKIKSEKGVSRNGLKPFEALLDFFGNSLHYGIGTVDRLEARRIAETLREHSSGMMEEASYFDLINMQA